MSGVTASLEATVERLLNLTRQRDFLAVIEAWRRTPAELRDAEIPSRLAAAACAQSGDLLAAVSILRRLVASRIAEPATLALAGRVLFDAGYPTESLDAWQRAMESQPENLGWWLWFARAALEAGQPERALRGSEVFTFHRESSEEASTLYAALLTKAHRTDEALGAMERTLARWPHHAAGGPAYAEFVMREFPYEARACLARTAWKPKASPLSPSRVRASLWMPAFFETEVSAAQWRADLLGEIRELTELAKDGGLADADRALCLSSTPFFAAYHDADVTPIQFAWGDFVEALVAPLRRNVIGAGSRPTHPRRVGIVSNRLTDSSAGRFFNGWVAELLASGFSVTLYAIGATDAETDRLASLTTLHRFPKDEVSHWEPIRARIELDANEVLLFPEPQGSPLTILLAGLRLAPVQIAAFGNPLTTGLRTVDFFLSPDAAEVAAPASQYREHVVRLSGIGTVILEPPSPSRFDRKSFGFGDDEHIYIVNQQLQKWTPDFLQAVTDLLTEDQKGRLVYFAFGSNVSVRAFQKQLRDRFVAAKMDVGSRALCVTGFGRNDYLALNRSATVSLDTFGYGGGSSTADAISVGLPVVTREGQFLRSRQSAGMLRSAGRIDSICSTTDAFVRLARDIAQSAYSVASTSDPSAPAPVRDSASSSQTSVASFLLTL